jgi:hypothetical protein
MRVEEVLAVGMAFASVLLASYVAETMQPILSSVFALVKYFAFALPTNWGIVPLLLLYFLGVGYVIVVFLSPHIKRRFAVQLVSHTTTKKVRIALVEGVRAMLVLALSFVSSAVLLRELSVVLGIQSKDMLLWNLDVMVLGAQPFVVLPTALTHPWATHAMFYLYASLPFVVGGFFVYLFIRSRPNLFRLALISFTVSVFLAWPLYMSFPCQDPGNYFVFNLYNNTFSQEVEDVMRSYAPTPLTTDYMMTLHRAETQEDPFPTVPISCFPSMHAVWGLLCVVFLGLMHRWIWMPGLLWLVGMLAGGVYFGQHYVVDYLAAIPFTILVLVLSRALLRMDDKKKPQGYEGDTSRHASGE